MQMQMQRVVVISCVSGWIFSYYEFIITIPCGMQKMKSVPNNHIEQLTQLELANACELLFGGCLFGCILKVCMYDGKSLTVWNENKLNLAAIFPFSNRSSSLTSNNWLRKNSVIVQYYIHYAQNWFIALNIYFWLWFHFRFAYVCGWKTVLYRYGHCSPVYWIKIHWFAKFKQNENTFHF